MSSYKTSDHNWGGVDPDYFRGALTDGRDRAIDAAHDGPVIVIETGTSVAAINDLIATAPSGAVVEFAAGVHEIDQAIEVTRGDITIRGADADASILKPVFTDAVDHVFVVRPEWEIRSPEWFRLDDGDAIANTQLIQSQNTGATTIRVASTFGFEAGKFVEVSQETTENLIGNDNYLGGLAEIASVDHDTNEVTLKHGLGFAAEAGASVRVTDLLDNLTISDLTIDYGEPENPVDQYRRHNHNTDYTDFLVTQGTKAMVVSYTHEANISDVTIRNAGSNGFLFATNLETYTDGLAVDGVQNMGGGGNGYAIELERTYYSTFEDVDLSGPIRHGVLFREFGSSGFNTIHVANASSNMDFHGGPDYGNFIFVETMDLGQNDDYGFPAVDYRDPANIDQNLVVFETLDAAADGRIPNYTPQQITGNDPGYSVDGFSSGRPDIVHASHNGAVIRTYSENDIIVLGLGNDLVYSGATDPGTFDDIYILGAGGQDVIGDFTPGEDRLHLLADANGNGLLSADDVLARLTVDANGHAVLPLGLGHQVTFLGLVPTDFSASDFVIFDSLDDVPGIVATPGTQMSYEDADAGDPPPIDDDLIFDPVAALSFNASIEDTGGWFIQRVSVVNDTDDMVRNWALTIDLDPGEADLLDIASVWGAEVTVLDSGDLVFTPTGDTAEVAPGYPENFGFFARVSDRSGAPFDPSDFAFVDPDTVFDPDTAVAISGASAAEGDGPGGTVTFTVTRTGDLTAASSVDFATQSESAVAGQDFMTAQGRLDFNPGETSRTITVDLLGDEVFEADETFAVVLSNPVGTTIGTDTGRGTILNDDQPPSQISVADAMVSEGNSGTTSLTFTLTRTGDTTGVSTVAYATVGGTAVAGSDFAAANGVVSFGTGQSVRTVTVDVFGDTEFETDETFGLVLSAPNNAVIIDGTATATIDNDDLPPPQIAVTGAVVEEGDTGSTSLTFTLTRTGDLDRTSRVDVATADGTAEAGTDYAAWSETVTFAPGEASRTVTIDILSDTDFEADETVFLVLSNPADATLTVNQVSGTIVNDDVPLPVIAIDDAGRNEGDAGAADLVFTVRRTGDLSEASTVTYTVDGATASAGSDFTPVSGTLIFDAGGSDEKIRVPIIGDTVVEGDESLTVTLSNPTGAAIGDGTATGTIRDDDAGASSSLDGLVTNIGLFDWGSGYSARFELRLTEELIEDGEVTALTLDVDLLDPDASFTNGFVMDFGAPVDFDAETGVFSTVGQDYTRTFVAGEVIDFTIQVTGTGFDQNDLAFSFTDLDPDNGVPAPVSDVGVVQSSVDDRGGAFIQRISVGSLIDERVDGWAVRIDLDPGEAGLLDIASVWGAQARISSSGDLYLFADEGSYEVWPGTAENFGFYARVSDGNGVPYEQSEIDVIALDALPPEFDTADIFSFA